MTQTSLAAQLQRKLGYERRPDTRPFKTRKSSKQRIVLAVPGDLGATELLRFNKTNDEIHVEQVAKVERETGLSLQFQRDLAKCRLEPSVARLLFYSYRMAHSLNGQPSVDFACGYVTFIRRHLEAAPPKPDAFWTVRRQRYLGALKTYRSKIAKNLQFAENAETRSCIDDFLGVLDAWGVKA